MSWPVGFHDAAEAELNEAASYYDMESPGLGVAFLGDIRHAIDTISLFPEAAAMIRGRVRRKTLLRFPYALIYSLRQAEIRILAVAHQKRRPFYWRGRR